MRNIKGLIKAQPILVPFTHTKTTCKAVYLKNISNNVMVPILINFNHGIDETYNIRLEDIRKDLREIQIKVIDATGVHMYFVHGNYYRILLECIKDNKHITGIVRGAIFFPRCPHCKLIYNYKLKY
jgi:hypothetical protein